MPPPNKTDADLSSDRALIKQALAGNEHAFTQLMRRFKLPLYRFAISHINDADDAEDIVQESFVAAYRNLARFDPQYEVSTWLFRITLNKCRDLGRKRKTWRFLTRMNPWTEEQASRLTAPDDPQEKILMRNELQEVMEQIAHLPDTLRSPLILCAIEDMSHKQAADILHISIKAVETRIYRARKILQQNQQGD